MHRNYTVTVKSTETRVFSVEAESANAATGLLDEVITQTNILSIGQNNDCTVTLDITAELQCEQTEVGKALVPMSEKIISRKPLSPEELFLMIFGKDEIGDEE